MREGLDEIAVGVLGEVLQRHGTSSSRADQALQLIPPVRGDLGVRMQGKALHAGTARTGARGRLVLVTKARANAPHLLSRAFAKGNALLHRGGHGMGELGGGVDQRIIARHHGVEAYCQVPELSQCADNPPADLLDHRGDVRVHQGKDRLETPFYYTQTS